MDFPTDIIWTSPFPILGLLDGIFHVYSKFKRTSVCKHQTPLFAASDLVLHYLPMSNKKDTRLIWVNVGIHIVYALLCNDSINSIFL